MAVRLHSKLRQLSRADIKKEARFRELLFQPKRQRPTFPGSLPPSIISAKELNFCVRYGNRCDLLAIVTGFLACLFRTLRRYCSLSAVLTYFCMLRSSKFACLAYCETSFAILLLSSSCFCKISCAVFDILYPEN